jgi:hypothetical protein
LHSPPIALRTPRGTSSILAALFIPCIRPWLMDLMKTDAAPNSQVSESNLRQPVEIMMKSGNEDDRRFLSAISAG